MRKTVIGLMGPGEQASLTECQTAYELGQRIAQAGWVLLTGGRNVGVMEAANRGAQAAGGLTVGILPSATTEGLSDAVDIAIVTGLGQARNAVNVLSSDVVIACGLGAGTLSEIALALKAKKPVILIQVPESAQACLTDLTPQGFIQGETPEAAIAHIQQWLTVNTRRTG